LIVDLEHQFTIEVAWNKVVGQETKICQLGFKQSLVGLVTKVTSHNKKTKAWDEIHFINVREMNRAWTMKGVMKSEWKGNILVSNLKLTLNPKIGQLDVLSLYIHTFLLGIDFRNICFFYLWRKVVYFVLFCSYEIHQTRMLQIVFLVSLESSWRGGVQGLGSMTFGLAVQKFWNIEWFLYWKLNQVVAENFGGIGMCLWSSWKDLDEQDLMEFIW